MRRFREPLVPAVRVGPLPAGVLLPEECACCGAESSHRRALARPARPPVLVGYCEDCALHIAGSETRQLAAALASIVLTLSAAATLPFLLPRLDAAALASVVALVALLPSALLLFPRARPTSPHVARSLAVRGAPGDCLLCLSPSYGAKLAALNGLTVEQIDAREPQLSAWQSAGPLLGLGAALVFHTLHHPTLRVVNLSATRVDLLIDGRGVASVDPSSQESSAAGVELHVPAGRHQLATRDAEGVVGSSQEVEFASGRVHLFAPGSDGVCFWLETVGYGREQRVEPSYQRLDGAERFWVLPDGIDLWFSPALSAGATRLPSSGGFITALRQAPCSQAPARVAE